MHATLDVLENVRLKLVSVNLFWLNVDMDRGHHLAYVLDCFPMTPSHY